MIFQLKRVLTEIAHFCVIRLYAIHLLNGIEKLSWLSVLAKFRSAFLPQFEIIFVIITELRLHVLFLSLSKSRTDTFEAHFNHI